MSFLADYHVHSKCSPDGSCSMIELIRQAALLGLTELAITDHFEFYTPGFSPEREGVHAFFHPFDEACLEQYFHDFQQASQQSSIRLISGVEIGQPYVNPEYSKKIMNQYHWDFVIGSVHKFDNVDLSQLDYPNIDLEKWMHKNLDALFQMADQEDFDVLGHIDLIKRYAARQGVTAHLRKYPEQLSCIFKRLAERGKGIEINTSGLRQQAKEALPSLEILKLYRDCGGEIITVGSDAHSCEQIGSGFKLVQEMLEKAGFRYAAVYRNRTPEFYSIK